MAGASGSRGQRATDESTVRMRRTRRAILGATALSAAGCLGVVGRSPTMTCPVSIGRSVDARIGLVGDVMVGRGVDERWQDGPPEGIWGTTLDRILSLDGLFCNLECCLSDRGSPRPGRTYHFRADPGWAVPALRAGGVSWVSLANNHVLDFGKGAFSDTLATLDAGGIAHAGAGSDLNAAVEPSVVEVGSLRVAVIAFTDRSPSYGAGPDSPGTAFVRAEPGNPIARRLVDAALARARERDPDLVVASLHWGPNWETRPSSARRRFARGLVDRGVDLVHGHSAHVVQGIEVYRGRPIVYDTGDFVDDYLVKPDLRNDRSFLFELAVEDGSFVGLRLVPIEIEAKSAHRADGDAARWLRDQMRDRSTGFGTTFRRAGDGLRVPLDRCEG
jgi:poly-gamma-glutamate synthesis protein (capsule biosynthesis protein)